MKTQKRKRGKMNEIVLSTKSGEPVASSRQVAENFGKEHKDTLESIRQILAAENSATKSMFYETTFENRGKQYPMYLMNRDGFTLLAMGFTGKAALEWKLKYIAAFNEMEKKLTEQPQLTRSQLLATALIAAHEELEEKDKQIETMKPKALFADAVSASGQSILVGEMAKLLSQNGIQMGQNRLFQWMRENGYLIKDKKRTDYNMPTQKSMELRLFEIKETSIAHSDGHTSINKTPKVTGIGQVYFVNLFLKTEKSKKAEG
jgi:anti-repressor protein